MSDSTTNHPQGGYDGGYGQPNPSAGQYSQPNQPGSYATGAQPFAPQQYGGQGGQPQFAQQAGQYGQAQSGQAQPGQPQYGQQPGQPAHKPAPTAVGATWLDWVRDAGGPFFLLLALVMVWNVSWRTGDVQLTAVVIAAVITAVIAALGGVFQLFTRMGVVPVSPDLAYLIRLGSQVPFVVTVLVYVVIDIVASFSQANASMDWTEFGVGAGAAIGLLGAMLTAQPRDYELRALGGLKSARGQLMQTIGMIAGYVFAGLVALGVLLNVVVLIVLATNVSKFGGDVNAGVLVFRLLATLVFTAAFVGLAYALFVMRSEVGRKLAIVVGASAALAWLIDGTFGLGLSVLGVESASSYGYPMLFAPVLGALAISPVAIANRKPVDRVESSFSALGLGLLAVAGAALAFILGTIAAFMSVRLEERTAPTVLVIVFGFLVVAAAVFGFLLLRTKRNETKQVMLLGVVGGAAVLGLLVSIMALVEQSASGKMVDILPASYALAALFFLPLALALALVFAPEFKEFFTSRGLGLQPVAGGGQPGYGQQAGQSYPQQSGYNQHGQQPGQPQYGQQQHRSQGAQSYGQPQHGSQGAQPFGEPTGYNQPGGQYAQPQYGNEGGQQYGGQASAQFGERADYGQTAQHGQPGGYRQDPQQYGQATPSDQNQGFGQPGSPQFDHAAGGAAAATAAGYAATAYDQQHGYATEHDPTGPQQRVSAAASTGDGEARPDQASGSQDGHAFSQPAASAGERVGQVEAHAPANEEANSWTGDAHAAGSHDASAQADFGEHAAHQDGAAQYGAAEQGADAFAQHTAAEQAAGQHTATERVGEHVATEQADQYGATERAGQYAATEEAAAQQPTTSQSGQHASTEQAAGQHAAPQGDQPVDLPALARRAMDPSTPVAELHYMAQYRELWPYLATAQQASPELLDWLAATNDPTVMQYLRQRGHIN